MSTPQIRQQLDTGYRDYLAGLPITYSRDHAWRRGWRQARSELRRMLRVLRHDRSPS